MRIVPKSGAYMEELKNIVPIKNSKDNHKIEVLHQTRKRFLKSRNTLFWLRILLYALLYASILSSMTILLELDYALPTNLDLLFTLVSIVGIILSVILVVVLTQSIETYDSDIKIIETHIMAIYVKHDKSSEETFKEFMKKMH